MTAAGNRFNQQENKVAKIQNNFRLHSMNKNYSPLDTTVFKMPISVCAFRFPFVTSSGVVLRKSLNQRRESY